MDSKPLNYILQHRSNLNFTAVSDIGGFVASSRFFLLLLTTLMLSFSIAVLADEYFDTQLKLAKQGNPESQFKIGEMYENGTGVVQNKREARYWFKRSANQGYEMANFKLLYWELAIRGLNDKNKAKVEELNNKAKQGNAQAQYYLGSMYANGVGINRNPDAAIDWLNKAASAGVLEAELELASLKEQIESTKQGKPRFESDPCSSKSAKFLSTCR
jgi:TPR repeat protein